MATLQMNILSLKLGMQANFSAIIPSYTKGETGTYDEIYKKGEKFKTLWLLGSEYGDDSEIFNYTSLLRYAEENHIAVVLPCVYNKLYSNDKKGQKFLDFITDELWTVCTGAFSLSKKREDNFIGGVSLGAYGALKAALRNPEKYSAAVMIGGAFNKNIKDSYIKELNDGIEKEGLIKQLPLDDAPADDLEIYNDALRISENKLSMPDIYISSALESSLSKYALEASNNLKELGCKVEFNGEATDDTWKYRDLALDKAINSFIKARI